MRVPQKLTLVILVAVISLTTSSHLVAHHEPFEKSIKKTTKMVNKYDGRFEKALLKTRESRKFCEKYYRRGEKYLMESPDSIWMKPSKRGNYPNSSSIGVVGKWGRQMGLLSLQGCPDGSSVTQDLALAHQYFEMGVFQYDEESMYQLGLLYINGQGVNKDKKMGLTWVNMAAAEWSENAAIYLTSNGLPVPKKVKHQTKMLIVNETHGDNVYTSPNSAFWEWIGIISVVAISAYAYYKLAPAAASMTALSVQQSVQPAVMSVSNTMITTTMCPDGSYQPQGTCTICPDGTFTTASGCLMAPDGSFVGDYGNGFISTPTGNYVPNTGSTVWCPDGKYHAGNWCHINPDGSFIGLTR